MHKIVFEKDSAFHKLRYTFGSGGGRGGGLKANLEIVSVIYFYHGTDVSRAMVMWPLKRRSSTSN